MPVDQVRSEFRLFKDFDQEIIEKMATEKNVIHFHKWGFHLEDFKSSKEFTNFFKLISIDTVTEGNGLQYPTSYEAYNYPIFCVLYHPEYQMIINRNETTMRIANSFSQLIN